MGAAGSPAGTGRWWSDWAASAWARLHDPAVLALVALAFLVSALGQSIVQSLAGERSVVTTAVLSGAGSVFLAFAIVVAARRHDRHTRSGARPDGGRH